MKADLTGFELAAGRTVCLICNLQNEFCRPDGAKYQPSYEACVEPVRRLRERARVAGIAAIFVRSVRERDDPAVVTWDAPVLPEGSPGAALVTELTPERDDHVVVAHRADPFHDTGLGELLSHVVPDPTSAYVLVMGIRSNYEHFHAVDGVHLRDYWTLIPLDCAAGSVGLHDEMADYYNPLQLWNVFQTRSDLVRFRVDGGPSRKLAPTRGTSRLLHAVRDASR